MSSRRAPCECATLHGDATFQLCKNVMVLIRKIINVINNLKTGQQFKNFCCIETCLRLLANNKIEHVFDPDLLIIGLEATKGYAESKVLVERCFKSVHKVDSIRKDLLLLHEFFSTYEKIATYGIFLRSNDRLPRILCALRRAKVIPFMFPESDMIFIFHNDLQLLYDKDYDNDLKSEGNNYLKSGVVKIKSEPFRSDLFASLNWLVFN